MRVVPFLCLIATCLLVRTAHAQENIGMATGNYAGVSGAWFNPASIVDSRFKLDITVYAFDSYFTNNFMDVRNTTLLRRLLQSDPYNGSYEAVKEDLLRPIKDQNEKVHAAATTQWQLPSFMINTGPKSAIALNLRSRAGMTLVNMDPNTARMLYDELENPDYFGQVQDNSGLNYSFLNWSELGLTYGRVLAQGKHHFLKVAATGKFLSGNAGIHIASDDLRFTVNGPESISIQSPFIEYARTSQADFDTYRRRNFFSGEDLAMGGDIGFVYELRGKVSKRMFTDFDQMEKERKDLNKYLVRVGVALLDVGKFTFDRRPLTQDHSADITNWDISELNASDIDDFDRGYSELVTYVPNGSPTFTYRLPTAISANIDLHVLGGFYVNLATYRDATGIFGNTYATLCAREWSAATLRFENRWFGAYVPISRSEGTTRVGATLRIGPVHFGSTNLMDIVVNDAGPTADYHAGVRFSIGHGKPSALKKRYEAIRQTNEGVSSNKVRIDSLEREVYALKMALLVDSTRGGATVINNYYTTGLDTTAQKLQMENFLLTQQLAEARVAENQAAEEGGAGSKAALRSSAKEAKAQEDVAKEMEKINKQMKRQTLLMATTAGATVAVAAKGDGGKDEKKDKNASAAATYVNDSTIVLNGDTIPLVITPADDSLRRSVRVDTVYLTVRDTVRLTETVRDTVQVTQQAPGTISKDEAELQRLKEPVYFATGRTTLGPQGRMKVAEMAAWLKKNPAARVEVTGVADASGSVSVNESVAQKRADSVRQELIANGIEPARISTSRKLAPAGATPNAKDRRAEVRFEP
jgi:outer membrane protein OmpA-like peptidoglycan-associated protein